MMPDQLSNKEREIILCLARQAIKQACAGIDPLPVDLLTLPERLREPGATFVTLTIDHDLRGCVGALEAYQPLAHDVQEHAVAAALSDFRFFPVKACEVECLEIEIYRLTSPVVLEYLNPEDLLEKLRPGVDGVLLKDGRLHATFLPQVWEKLPDPALFLNYLCQKVGAPPDQWRRKMLQVFIYRVEEFCE